MQDIWFYIIKIVVLCLVYVPSGFWVAWGHKVGSGKFAPGDVKTVGNQKDLLGGLCPLGYKGALAFCSFGIISIAVAIVSVLITKTDEAMSILGWITIAFLVAVVLTILIDKKSRFKFRKYAPCMSIFFAGALILLLPYTTCKEVK